MIPDPKKKENGISPASWMGISSLFIKYGISGAK